MLLSSMFPKFFSEVGPLGILFSSSSNVENVRVMQTDGSRRSSVTSVCRDDKAPPPTDKNTST